MEHSSFDMERIADLLSWLKATDIAPFVRVPQNLYHFVARAMDAGALGVMVGNVESTEQARAVVKAVKYAPMGSRGVGLGMAHTDYVVPQPELYFRRANENTTVICQIESQQGVFNAEAIAGVSGVDVLWVGHLDLSQSLGIPGKFQDPRFVEALRSVVQAARYNRKAAAVQPPNTELAAQWLALGFNVVSCRTDILVYRNALQKEIAAIRNLAHEGQVSSLALDQAYEAG
jgi:2-keto-3-deoxy-L-rhamnonate aldolase RhmA